jgi:drug/metabolite transporter (DMT)-like permease
MRLFRLAPFVFLGVWSGGFTALIVALRGTEPLTLLALRYAICVAILAPLAALLRPAMPAGRDLLHLVVNALIVQVAYFALVVYSLHLGLSAGASALIIALQPVAVALLAPWTVGERVPRIAWAGLAAGLAGTVLVVTSRGAVHAEGVAGVAAAVGGLITMTAGVLYEKRFGRAHHPVAANLVIYLVGMLACAPLAWAAEGLQVTWSVPFALAMAYLVLGNSLLSMSLLLAMVRRGEAARVSALFFLVPPIAALIAWVTVGEVLGAGAWLGMALAAAGVALVARGRS